MRVRGSIRAQGMTQQFDVAIIGAGINGLTAAAYLAKGGRKVVVLERGDRVGGAAANRESFPGFVYPTAGYASPLIHPSVVRDLDLGRHGLNVFPMRGNVTLSHDGDALATYADPDATARAIHDHSHRDAEAYQQMIVALKKFAAITEPLMLADSENARKATADPLAGLDRLHGLITDFGERNVMDAIRWSVESLGDALDRWFEIPLLKAHLASRAMLGASLGPYSGTTAPLLSKTLGYFGGQGGGAIGYVRGGAGALSEALVKALWSFGGDVRLDASVSDIQLKDGKATGVVLDRGEEIEVETVISSLDIKQTFLTLFDWKALQQNLIDKVLNVKTRGAMGKLNLALDSMPRFPGVPAGSPLWMGDWQLTTTLTDMERAYDDWKNKVLPKKAHIVFNTPTVFDTSLAPTGKHVMSVFIQYLTDETLEGAWDVAKKDQLTNQIIDQLSEFSPGLKDIILDTDLQTPTDLEETFGLSGGHIFHGETSPDSFFLQSNRSGVANHRSPIGNLYLCGSGCHPAGGLLAMSGQMAASVVQRDLTPRRWL